VLTGSGDLELAKLPVERATVEISGSGDIEVDATRTLDVRISGSGSVAYHGNPEVKKSISGSGGLIKK
jgi:putative autotransporter adhesin-like protein